MNINIDQTISNYIQYIYVYTIYKLSIYLYLYIPSMAILYLVRGSPDRHSHRRTLGDFDVKMTVKPGVISIVPEASGSSVRLRNVRQDARVPWDLWLKDSYDIYIYTVYIYVYHVIIIYIYILLYIHYDIYIYTWMWYYVYVMIYIYIYILWYV